MSSKRDAKPPTGGRQHPEARNEVHEETVLTPTDVAALCECTVRVAFTKMREAGAVSFGRSLRITRTKFLAWLDNEGRAVKVRASAGVPLSDLLDLHTRRNTVARKLLPPDDDDLVPLPTCRTPRRLPGSDAGMLQSKPGRKART